METCRNFGSARGCRYGRNCYFSHDYPESVSVCKYKLRGKNCRAGNGCQYRHNILQSDKQQLEKEKKLKKPAVIVELLLELSIEYHPNKWPYIQYKTSWKDRTDKSQQYNYQAANPSKLMNYLKNNGGHGVIADLGLFVQKKSNYTNNDWCKWMKVDNKKFGKLKEKEQTNIIIHTRKLINFYNKNYRYLIKKFHPWTYYRTKIIVYGFINNLVRNDIKYVQFCPDEIMKMIFNFYYAVAKYKLFDYTNTIKISDDESLIQTRRYTHFDKISDQISLPFIIYKIENYKFLKLRIKQIPPNFVFSIGIINSSGLESMKELLKTSNPNVWPFEKLNGLKYQFYFGNKDQVKERTFTDNDVYCGELSEGDILTLDGVGERGRWEDTRGPWRDYWTQYYVELAVKKKGKHKLLMPRYKSIHSSNAYPAIAFDYDADYQTEIEILNVESDALNH